MRLLGFLLGFLLIFGLVRLVAVINRDFSFWTSARPKPSGTSLQHPASLAPLPPADQAGTLTDPFDHKGVEQHIERDDSATVPSTRNAMQLGGIQQPVDATEKPLLPLSAAEARPSPMPEPPDVPSGPDVTQFSGSDDVKWQPFWRPFSSPASAHGFARSIAEQTGLEVKVIRVRAGRYEVAFAYREDEDRIAGARLIEREMGLKIELPDAGP